MHLVTLRAEADALARAVAEAAVGFTAGTGAAPDWPALVAANPLATSREAVVRVRELAESSEGRPKARLQALAHALFTWRIHAAAPSLRREVDRARALVRLEGGDDAGALQLDEAEARLPRLTSRGARERLDRLLEAARTQRAPGVWRLAEVGLEVAQSNGFSSPMAGEAALLGIDFEGFLAETRAFLASTQSAWDDVGAWWMDRAAGVRWFPGGAAWHDGMHAWAGGPFEAAFPASSLARRVAAPFEKVGLEATASGRVRFELADRAHLRSVAYVGGPAVPETVRVVCRALGGPAAVTSFLRVLGDALAQAGCDPDRPPEDRLMGDHAVTQASGVAFAWLSLEPEWLRRVMNLEDADVRRVTAWVELARLRRLAARALHLVDLATDGAGPSTDARSAERWSSWLGVRVPESLPSIDALETAWIPGQSPLFELRAAALGLSLFDGLRDRFDEDWWRNPRTGAFLKLSWHHGRFQRVPELVERLELVPPTLANVAVRLGEALR